MYYFGETSLSRIHTGTTILQQVIHGAMKIANSRFKYGPDFSIVEVLRGSNEQFKRFKVGREHIDTKWVIKDSHRVITYCDGYSNPSTHQTAKAVDFCGYINHRANYEPENLAVIATYFMQAASDLNIQYKWGGHYTKFYDGGHFNII